MKATWPLIVALIAIAIAASVGIFTENKGVNPKMTSVSDAIVSEMLARIDSDDPRLNQVVFDVRSSIDVNHAVFLLRLVYLIADSGLNMHSIDRVSPHLSQRHRLIPSPERCVTSLSHLNVAFEQPETFGKPLI